MENKFELVEKYNIDVDVFIDEDGVTPVGKLPDNHLTKEFLRLYFTGQITKVWKRWLSDIYYAMTSKGKEIFHRTPAKRAAMPLPDRPAAHCNNLLFPIIAEFSELCQYTAEKGSLFAAFFSVFRFYS